MLGALDGRKLCSVCRWFSQRLLPFFNNWQEKHKIMLCLITFITGRRNRYFLWLYLFSLNHKIILRGFKLRSFLVRQCHDWKRFWISFFHLYPDGDISLTATNIVSHCLKAGCTPTLWFSQTETFSKWAAAKHLLRLMWQTIMRLRYHTVLLEQWLVC